MTTPPKILIFDSGVGGLTVLDEISRRTPWCDLVYTCDNAEFPYGAKSEEALVSRVESLMRRLIQTEQPDMIVVACNTASTIALPHIRTHFKLPVVGVVPAIKPAALSTKTGVFGLLATPGTISRPYTQSLIEEFAPDCEILRVGSPRLVEIAEDKFCGRDVNIEEIRQIIAPLFVATHRGEADKIVLACTHFPLLRLELVAAAPRYVSWIDSGSAIARRVADLLPDFDQARRPEHLFDCLVSTDNLEPQFAEKLCQLGCGSIRCIEDSNKSAFI